MLVPGGYCEDIHTDQRGLGIMECLHSDSLLCDLVLPCLVCLPSGEAVGVRKITHTTLPAALRTQYFYFKQSGWKHKFDKRDCK